MRNFRHPLAARAMMTAGLVVAITAISNAPAQAVPGPMEVAGMPANSLPGDQGPVQLRPGEKFVPFAGGGPPPWERGPVAPGPSLAQALKSARAAINACRASHFAVGVTIIDSVGQPRISLVSDGVRGWHSYSALRKALTALALQEASSLAMREIEHATPLVSRIKPYMTTLPGGVPIILRGKLIGAIGVSGARSGESDEACARAGAASLAGRGQ